MRLAAKTTGSTFGVNDGGDEGGAAHARVLMGHSTLLLPPHHFYRVAVSRAREPCRDLCPASEQFESGIARVALWNHTGWLAAPPNENTTGQGFVGDEP